MLSNSAALNHQKRQKHAREITQTETHDQNQVGSLTFKASKREDVYLL